MFVPITRGDAANITNSYQTMNYTHIRKDLDRDEHLSLNHE